MRRNISAESLEEIRTRIDNIWQDGDWNELATEYWKLSQHYSLSGKDFEAEKLQNEISDGNLIGLIECAIFESVQRAREELGDSNEAEIKKFIYHLEVTKFNKLRYAFESDLEEQWFDYEHSKSEISLFKEILKSDDSELKNWLGSSLRSGHLRSPDELSAMSGTSNDARVRDANEKRRDSLNKLEEVQNTLRASRDRRDEMLKNLVLKDWEAQEATQAILKTPKLQNANAETIILEAIKALKKLEKNKTPSKDLRAAIDRMIRFRIETNTTYDGKISQKMLDQVQEYETMLAAEEHYLSLNFTRSPEFYECSLAELEAEQCRYRNRRGGRFDELQESIIKVTRSRNLDDHIRKHENLLEKKGEETETASKESHLKKACVAGLFLEKRLVTHSEVLGDDLRRKRVAATQQYLINYLKSQNVDVAIYVDVARVSRVGLEIFDSPDSETLDSLKRKMEIAELEEAEFFESNKAKAREEKLLRARWNPMGAFKHDYKASWELKEFQGAGSVELLKIRKKLAELLDDGMKPEESNIVSKSQKAELLKDKSNQIVAANKRLRISQPENEELLQAPRKLEQLYKFELSEKERQLEKIERESQENNRKLEKLHEKILEIEELQNLKISQLDDEGDINRIVELSEKFKNLLAYDGQFDEESASIIKLQQHAAILQLDQEELEQKSRLFAAQKKFIQTNDPQDKMREYQANLELKLVVVKQQLVLLEMEKEEVLENDFDALRARVESGERDIAQNSLRRVANISRDLKLLKSEQSINLRQIILFEEISKKEDAGLIASTIAWQEAIEKTRSENLESDHAQNTVKEAYLQWEQNLSAVNDPKISNAKKELDLAELSQEELKIVRKRQEFEGEVEFRREKLQDAWRVESKLLSNQISRDIANEDEEVDLNRLAFFQQNISQTLSQLPREWRDHLIERPFVRKRESGPKINLQNLLQGISDVEERNQDGEEDELLRSLRYLESTTSKLDQLQQQQHNKEKQERQSERATKAVTEAQETLDLSLIQQQENFVLSEVELKILNLKRDLIQSDDLPQREIFEKEIKEAEIEKELLIAQIEMGHVQQGLSQDKITINQEDDQLRLDELNKEYLDTVELRKSINEDVAVLDRESLIQSLREDKVEQSNLKASLETIEESKPQALKELEAERDALLKRFTKSLQLKITNQENEIDLEKIDAQIELRNRKALDEMLTRRSDLERIKAIMQDQTQLTESQNELYGLLNKFPLMGIRVVGTYNEADLKKIDEEINKKHTYAATESVIKDLIRLADVVEQCTKLERQHQINPQQQQEITKFLDIKYDAIAEKEGIIEASFERSEDSREYDLLLSKRKLLKLPKDSPLLDEAQQEVFAAQVKKDRVAASKKMFEAEFGKHGESGFIEGLIDAREEFGEKKLEAQRELDKAANAISPEGSLQETVAIDALAAAKKLKEFQQSSGIILSEEEKAKRAQEIQELRAQQSQSVKALKAQNKIDSENGQLDDLGLSEVIRLKRRTVRYSRENPFQKTSEGVEFIGSEATTPEEENKFNSLIAAGKLREAIIKKAEFEFNPNLLTSDGKWNQNADEQEVQKWQEFCESIKIEPSYLARKSRQHFAEVTIADLRVAEAQSELEIVTLKEKLLGNEVEDDASVASDMSEEVVDERVINAQIKIKELEKEWLESKRVEAILQKEFDDVGNDNRALKDTNERFLKQQKIDVAEKYCEFKTAEIKFKYAVGEIGDEKLGEEIGDLEDELEKVRVKEKSRERSSLEIEAEKVFLDAKLQERILLRDLSVQEAITKHLQDEKLIREQEIQELDDGKEIHLKEKALEFLEFQIAKSADELAQIELAVENKRLDVAEKKHTSERLELKFKYDNGKINQDEFNQGLAGLEVPEEIYLEEPKKKRALEEKLQKTMLEREGSLSQDQVRPYSRKEEGQGDDPEVILKSWKRLEKEKVALNEEHWNESLPKKSTDEEVDDVQKLWKRNNKPRSFSVSVPTLTTSSAPQEPRAAKLILIDPKNVGAAFVGTDRKNKFRIQVLHYANDQQIVDTIVAIICSAAKEARNLPIERAMKVIENARKSGGVSNLYDKVEDSYKDNTDITLNSRDKTFSALFQEKCAECGIYTGRKNDENLKKPLVGLRTAFIPEEVLISLKARIESPEQDDKNFKIKDKKLLKEKNIKLRVTSNDYCQER